MSLKDIKNRFQDEGSVEIGDKKYTFKWDSLNEVYEVVERRRSGPSFSQSSSLGGITFMSEQAFQRFRETLSKL